MRTRRKTRGRGRGFFDKKKSSPFSEKAYNKLGEKYQHDAYTAIKAIVDNYDAAGKLAEGFTTSQVDGMLSKFVDEPRNIDGLTRVKMWTYHLLDSKSYSLRSLLSVFWESHDPTQGMRQGNDVGTQYRSLIMCYSKEHKNLAIESKNIYQKHLSKNGFGEITTEIVDASTFFYAEGYHQQYLHKNPGGYCGLKGTGVICQSS